MSDTAGGGKRILLVEDDAAIREMYALRLEQEGFSVSKVEDGELGLSEACTTKPDLIILDIKMPHMDGFSVLKKLRAQGEWGANVPVIFFTNVVPDDTSELSTVSSTAPAFYLIKSKTSPNELVTKILEVFN